MSSTGGTGSEGLMRVENRAKFTTPLCGFGSWKWHQMISVKTLGLLLLVIGGVIVYYLIDTQTEDSAYYSPLQSSSPRFTLEEMREFAFKNSMATDYKPSFYNRRNLSFNKILENNQYRFNIYGKDVLVFLHIQKTAGTSFERFLVNKLDVVRPCSCRAAKKRCNCYRPHSQNEVMKRWTCIVTLTHLFLFFLVNHLLVLSCFEVWLFSRYSTGWVCGLHADYTELFVSGCVDNALDKKEGLEPRRQSLLNDDSDHLGVHSKRRYFYTTFLREPISRFISEYRHVHRGATWLASRHMCNGRPPTPEELPMCFDPEIGWDGLSLDEFLNCPYNLAFNRHTRMLADLTLVNCYNTKGMDATTRDKVLLESAKTNLRNMAFFGIKERMQESQWMFENIFQANFTASLSEWNKSKSHDTAVTPEQLERIKRSNHLDIELYKYAVKLFDKRLRKLKDDDYSHPNVMVSVNKMAVEVTSKSSFRERELPTTISPGFGSSQPSNTSLYDDPEEYDSDEDDEEDDATDNAE
uniref:Heparan-sulfate 6-O-sulfotransferase n=1 Tax=Steinernema glaseri TaxID=37863 RepID=A0A1I8AW96_9BILA